jgi:adenylate cyclase
MDRIFQWVWDRHGARYSWVLYAISVPFSLPGYLLPAFLIVAVENSDDYVDAGAVSVVALIVLAYVIQRPGSGPARVVEH